MLDEDVPYSIVVKNIAAEEKRDMFKAFAMHFFMCFLYITYSICNIWKSLKQQFFTNSEAATGRVLWKKVFLETSQNSQENTYVRVSFLIKLQGSACNFMKK